MSPGADVTTVAAAVAAGQPEGANSWRLLWELLARDWSVVDEEVHIMVLDCNSELDSVGCRKGIVE